METPYQYGLTLFKHGQNMEKPAWTWVFLHVFPTPPGCLDGVRCHRCVARMALRVSPEAHRIHPRLGGLCASVDPSELANEVDLRSVTCIIYIIYI
jgi:hypothetical protein